MTDGRSGALLANVDLAPTLCDLLGMPTPAEWDGASFRKILEGGGGPGRDHVVWDCGLCAVQRGVRTRRHLMIRTYDTFGYHFEPVELFDMERDPHQTCNIAAESPEVVRDCSEKLLTWVEDQMRKNHWVSDPLGEILRERSAG